MVVDGSAELTGRDRAILRDLARVRLLTGRHLERLHFADLKSSNARGSSRRRALGRLASLRLVTTLPRRVGGERAGSAGLIYSLDARGLRLLAAEARAAGDQGRVRRPWPVGQLFISHTLDVADLYVRLRDAERIGQLRLRTFEAEPLSWYPTAVVVLKPDAFVIIERGDWEQHWWVEVDRGTESLPTLRRMLLTYLNAVAGGAAGPAGVVPLVLVTANTSGRRQAVESIVAGLPAPAGDLIRIASFAETFTFPTSANVSEARPPP